MSRPTEDEIIARLLAPIAGAGSLGFRDDVALLTPPAGHQIVATTDAVVAGVHFFPDDPPDTIARKIVRVNLSDLAAKGADPLGLLLTLALPDTIGEAWLAAFAVALGEDTRLFAAPLVGGDTVRMPGPLTLSITALGTVPAGALVPRTVAQAGDVLYVTGTIGDAALGLKVRRRAASDRPWLERLDERDAAFLVGRYRVPEPRLRLRTALRGHAHAAMDVSDGLIGDTAKLLRASGMGGTLRLASVPFSTAAQAAYALRPELLEAAVTGGDDYEILASVPAVAAPGFEAQAARDGIAVSAIGHVEPEAGLRVFDASGIAQAFGRPSFSHF